jgi:hypothetical protein
MKKEGFGFIQNWSFSLRMQATSGPGGGKGVEALAPGRAAKQQELN